MEGSIARNSFYPAIALMVAVFPTACSPGGVSADDVPEILGATSTARPVIA